VSLTVAYLPAATRALRRFREEDEALFRRMRAAIRALAQEPHPAGAVPWGNSGIWRLHAGGIRITYEVDEEASAVYILSVALVS
jgi:mRNA interferase RelE/StbE